MSIETSGSIRPVGDFHLVEPISPEEKQVRGIFIPANRRMSFLYGRVLRSGPGDFAELGEAVTRYTPDGPERLARHQPARYKPMRAGAGDVVLYANDTALSLERDGKELHMLRDSSVLAVIEQPLEAPEVPAS